MNTELKQDFVIRIARQVNYLIPKAEYADNVEVEPGRIVICMSTHCASSASALEEAVSYMGNAEDFLVSIHPGPSRMNPDDMREGRSFILYGESGPAQPECLQTVQSATDTTPVSVLSSGADSEGMAGLAAAAVVVAAGTGGQMALRVPRLWQIREMLARAVEKYRQGYKTGCGIASMIVRLRQQR